MFAVGTPVESLPFVGSWKPNGVANICSGMPRFYNHLCNGTGFTEDHDGAELPDLETAKTKAIDGLRDVTAGEVKRGEINLGSLIEIQNEKRKHLVTVSFADAVRVDTGPARRS